MMDMDDGYIFLIDTDKYAGNFEREMCAFMTGTVGASGAGEKEAIEFFEEMGLTSREDQLLRNPFSDTVIQIPRDSECCRAPCSIWGNEINSVAIFLCRKPSTELMATMQGRAYQFGQQRGISIKNFRLIKKQSIYTEEKMEG